MGVGGSDAMRVSKRGIASGSERRVIQNAKGFALWLNTRSEVRLCEVVGGRGRVITDSGTVNWDLAVSNMFT